jgi:hypothetical protein
VGGFTPGMNLTWGISPHQLEFFWNFFLVLNNLIILSVILRYLEAELSILRCLKLIRGVISTSKKKKISSFIFFWLENTIWQYF